MRIEIENRGGESQCGEAMVWRESWRHYECSEAVTSGVFKLRGILARNTARLNYQATLSVLLTAAAIPVPPANTR